MYTTDNNKQKEDSGNSARAQRFNAWWQVYCADLDVQELVYEEEREDLADAMHEWQEAARSNHAFWNELPRCVGLLPLRVIISAP